MNFCSLCSSPIAISLICSSENEIVVPNDTNITEFGSCLSSHNKQDSSDKTMIQMKIEDEMEI
ncbi:hypothetical protein H5410_054080 [Solanum commersonii]|uniref:Uncharacterized protein n=1 Tax=Solanum commersonii TaxID=4109 RepID=A0A9J5X7L3_SOLCO|nr:hypothetical protein H5410_054080 [Solanum commersonii]